MAVHGWVAVHHIGQASSLPAASVKYHAANFLRPRFHGLRTLFALPWGCKKGTLNCCGFGLGLFSQVTHWRAWRGLPSGSTRPAPNSDTPRGLCLSCFVQAAHCGPVARSRQGACYQQRIWMWFFCVGKSWTSRSSTGSGAPKWSERTKIDREDAHHVHVEPEGAQKKKLWLVLVKLVLVLFRPSCVLRTCGTLPSGSVPMRTH